MQLQVALDVLDLPAALTLADQVSEHVDILELGMNLSPQLGHLP
ncbi:3-keto-L-gulonate-6-phosphate decarboxylase [Amycolatopsis endophytica]|uniref:3-keto-L-gulonate-6-phosphate decarboxylase n=1 Tax=Amycolatopsis endophytica TaxID=860233 RepID=A0A853B651_9PSEU|nr:orotidine 5'-phosphate decarboxylase / HUMPS family protein [Amycolatopsis endophytica]NYI90718.1 3-keto-L-gulonate-6-phosphate decarboxylase [Amycolatopsis endophytica]